MFHMSENSRKLRKFSTIVLVFNVWNDWNILNDWNDRDFLFSLRPHAFRKCAEALPLLPIEIAILGQTVDGTISLV
jgi:hypothetical protein